MKHQLLFDAYLNAFSTRQLDDLHDVLSPDFYFDGPTIKISGRDNFIQYSKEIFIVHKIETQSLHSISDTGFVHDYYYSYLDYDGYSFERLLINESFSIVNNLIASSKIRLNVDLLAVDFKDTLKKVASKFDE